MSSTSPSEKKFPLESVYWWYSCPFCSRTFYKVTDTFAHAKEKHGEEGKKYVQSEKPENYPPGAWEGRIIFKKVFKISKIPGEEAPPAPTSVHEEAPPAPTPEHEEAKAEGSTGEPPQPVSSRVKAQAQRKRKRGFRLSKKKTKKSAHGKTPETLERQHKPRRREPIFKCRFCGTAFLIRDALRRHVKRNHSSVCLSRKRNGAK